MAGGVAGSVTSHSRSRAVVATAGQQVAMEAERYRLFQRHYRWSGVAGVDFGGVLDG